MKISFISLTTLVAALALWLTSEVRADVASAVSSGTPLDIRSGLLTVKPADLPKSLADNALATSSLTVENLVGTVADAIVSLQITHPNTGDLTVWLISPQGTRVLLVTQAGGSGDNFTATLLDDEAGTDIGSGTAPFTGSFRPAEPLSAFDNQDPNGTWTLEILDAVTDNPGTLMNWSLRFDINPALAALTVTTLSPLPDWPVGVAYSHPFNALGGTPPYTWEVVAGGVPEGLTLDPVSGTLSGTPTGAGTAVFRVRVSDSAGGSATKDLSLPIRSDTTALALGATGWGTISPAGEVDELTFFGRAGHLVTVVANPGSGGSNVPSPPFLNRVRVELRNPGGALVDSSENAAAGQVLVLNNVALTADGTYSLRIKAPGAASSATGNYTVTVWDATPDEATLVLNSQSTGRIDNPYQIDRWTFSAVAGQQVRFRMLSPSNSRTGFSLNGPVAWTGFSDLSGDSNLITLPTSGSYTLSARSLGGAYDAGYSFRLDETSQSPIIAGTPLSGHFHASGQAQIFQLDVSESMPLLLELANAGAGNQVEIYLKFGAPPTRGDFDFNFSTPASSNQQILVPSAASGTWYVLVYGDYIPTPGDYTLTATLNEVILTGVSPARFGNGADTVITLSGAGFVPGNEVHLLAADGTEYPAAAVHVLPGGHMTAEFSAWSMPAASYGLRVTLPSGSQALWTASVEVLANARAVFNSRVIAPGFVRYNSPATIFVEYSNDGDLAMPAPLLELSGVQSGQERAFLTLDETLSNKAFTTDQLPDGFHNTVRFLASGATPGTLQPGETVRIPVYFGGWQRPWNLSYPLIRFGLQILHHDNPTPVDWTGRFGARPPGEVDSGWPEIFANVQVAMGATWGEHVLALDRMAGDLYVQYGAEIRDVEELEFHVLRNVDDGRGAPVPDPPMEDEPPPPAPGDIIQPGTVYKYAGGPWIKTADDESLNAGNPTFVIIHGWNNTVNSGWQANMASALAGQNPGANVLAVDWSVWAQTGPIWKAGATRSAYNIPIVADRLAWRLFAPSGATMPDVWRMANWLTGRDDEYEAPVVGLGLNPSKTHIIGHSHGAHVAGLTAQYTLHHREFGIVKRVTALDPSMEYVHLSAFNFQGQGWGSLNRSAAYIDAYSSSKAGPWDRTYGDDNFLLSLEGFTYEFPELGPVFGQGVGHTWAHQWFTLTIHDGGPLGLGYSWSPSRWHEITGNTARFDVSSGPWRGLIRGDNDTLKHVLEAMSPAVTRPSDYPSRWYYPGGWGGRNWNERIVDSLAGVVEFEPKPSGTGARSAEAGGPVTIFFNVVDNSDIKSVSRVPRNSRKGEQDAADARFQVWLSQKEELDEGNAILLTEEMEAVFAGQWSLTGEPPQLMTSRLAVPSKEEIEAKWPDVVWPSRFQLIVELSDGRLKDMYPANNQCAIPVDIDGEGIAAAIEPVVIVDTDGDGSELVTLDGRASGPKDAIVHYSWQFNGSLVGEGPALEVVEVVVPVGYHTASLTVSDGLGQTHTAPGDIIVMPGEPQAPTGGGPGGTTRPVGPVDPNELIGPGGYGPENYLAGGTSLPYRINFENDEDATAPAQVVELSNPLPDEFDLATFEWTEIGFGDVVLTIPPHTRYYETVVPLEIDGENIEVWIQASLDVGNRQASVNFFSLDPDTNGPPGILTGFLPPEDGSGRGMGHASYIVRSKPGLAAGTAIRNIAYIVFDGQLAIATNQVDPHNPGAGTDPDKEALVTLDDGPPEVTLSLTPTGVGGTNVDVEWTGHDRGGAGIESYDVHVSINGGPFEPWLNDTQSTRETYPSFFGQELTFQVTARDYLQQESREGKTTVIIDDDYLHWRAEHFGEAVGDPAQRTALWDDDADPDNDGRTNLYEFLAATDPRLADAEHDPTVRTEGDSMIYRFRLTKVENHLVDHVLEWSPDGVRWFTGGLVYREVEDHPGYRMMEAVLALNGQGPVEFRYTAERDVVYNHWIYEEGATFEERNPEQDPNRDGLPNAIAYALGLPAIGPVPPNDRERFPLPVVDVTPEDPEAHRGGIQFGVPSRFRPDVTLIVEASPNLRPGSWREVARRAGTTNWTLSDMNGAGLQTREEDGVVITTITEELTTERYYRLRAAVER